MKRPLYHPLCATACTSMVNATMPMAAIAEGGSASEGRRAAGASREVELSVAFECRKTSPNAAASGPLGRSHLGLMSTKLALAVG